MMQTTFQYKSPEGLWEMRHPGPKLYLNNREVEYGGLYGNDDPHNLLFSKLRSCYRWFKRDGHLCVRLAPGAVLSVSKSGEVLLNDESPSLKATIGCIDARSGEDYSTSPKELDMLVQILQQLPKDSLVWTQAIRCIPDNGWGFTYDGYDIVFLPSGAIKINRAPFYGDCTILSEPKVGALDLLQRDFLGLSWMFRFTPHGVFFNEEHFWSTVYIPYSFKREGRFLAYEGWTSFDELRKDTPSAKWHWECYEFLFNLLVRKS